MITGLERLAAAVRGEVLDRVPVFVNLLDQGARELGVSLRDYYADGERVAEGQLRLREKYGYDNLWSLFYVGKEAELLGCRHIVYADDGPPNVGELVLREPGDIGRLRVPDDLAGHPAFRETRRCLAVLRREAGGRYPICAYLTASATLPAILMGMERWLDLLLNGPESLRDELLAKCSEFFRRQAIAYREAGADVLLYSNPFGSTDLVPRRLFERVSLPWMRRDLEAVGTRGVVYYCGGARMNPVVEAVRAATGLSAYYLSPMDDLAEARGRLGAEALCAGVINDIPLIDWSPAEVRAEVGRIMAAGVAAGPFLFGTLVMPVAIPAHTIRALVEAACELGRPGGARG